MKSPEHKQNILNKRYNKIGVVMVKNNSGGLMIVQEFIEVKD